MFYVFFFCFALFVLFFVVFTSWFPFSHVSVYIYICIYLIWRFPEIGVPLNHPYFRFGFSITDHPASGVSACMETF